MAKKAVLTIFDRQRINGMLSRPQGATVPECFYAVAGHVRQGFTPGHVRTYVKSVGEPISGGKIRRGAGIWRLRQVQPVIQRTPPAEFTHAGFVERALEAKE